jgi:DNA polymerase-1
LLNHLTTVEMVWTRTTARMVWNGARVDMALCRDAWAASDRHLAVLQPQLDSFGIGNVRSPTQLKQFFGQINLLELFRRHGKYTFDKKQLATVRDRHPAIPLIQAARRVYELKKERILTGEFIGADGRVHPDYGQLGAHSGRQTCRWPNLLGLGRLFRPFVIPEPGYGIGEVDLSQIEVGIAAAVYNDGELIRMFNTGDVYAAMAQHFYRNELPDADCNLPSYEFKKKHGGMRNRMKNCTLGMIFGVTAHGLAIILKTPEHVAAALQERFMSMFPTLRDALAATAMAGGLCGYAATVSGLRRYRKSSDFVLSQWEANWMKNQPVQGSAATVFKAAGNRLDKLYQQYGARLIVPMHDAFVFEAPLDVLNEAAELTGRVMRETVQEYFPVLRPKVDVNIEKPECWNKEGHADSIRHWIQDPMYSF